MWNPKYLCTLTIQAFNDLNQNLYISFVFAFMLTINTIYTNCLWNLYAKLSTFPLTLALFTIFSAYFSPVRLNIMHKICIKHFCTEYYEVIKKEYTFTIEMCMRIKFELCAICPTVRRWRAFPRFPAKRLAYIANVLKLSAVIALCSFHCTALIVKPTCSCILGQLKNYHHQLFYQSCKTRE